MIIREEIDRSISHGNIGHLNKCDVSYVYYGGQKILNDQILAYQKMSM
jgi:hypothetical protein